jgi:chromate reductase
MADTLKLVTLLGSLRQASFNRMLAQALPDLAPEGVELTLLPGIGTLPHYDADLQADGFPAEVTRLGDLIRAADGVIIVSPEYNYSIPGTLKNALDWLSRLPEQPFARKPVAIQSASPGGLGGARMQYHLRQVFVFLEAYVLPRPEVIVGSVADKFDASGALVDEGTRGQVQKQLVTLAEFIRTVR